MACDVRYLVEGERDALHRSDGQQPHQVILVLEISVERSVRHPGCAGDVVDPGAVVSLRDEYLVGDLEQRRKGAAGSRRERFLGRVALEARQQGGAVRDAGPVVRRVQAARSHSGRDRTTSGESGR